MCFEIIVVVVCVMCVSGSGIYHENTKITFQNPAADAELFGYSVVLNRYGLIVGAPKARTRPGQTGLVFNCSLDSLDTIDARSKTVNCTPAVEPTDLSRAFNDDMWFGATVASLTDGKALYCAPRYTEPYSSKHLLAHGVCLISIEKGNRHSLVYPLSERGRQAFMTDGKRKEYGDYGTHLNFYAYGQAGMSVKVIENGNVIIGAPGLLQWTGGIVNYRFNPREGSNYFSKQIISNPYYTRELGPDDYFGYSVEAGIFQLNAKTLFVGGAPRSMRGYGQVLVFEPATREQNPLNIHATLRGPQLGAYFGASLCCLDIDGDGISDLLVGAPTYVTKDGGLPYDQGAVFVYMTKQVDNGFNLTNSGHVMGSSASGARFGTTIADLGDVDGDGFRDVAIGAPWENDESGVVYIYRGSAKGLKSQYTQKIEAEGARSFGISIPKGIDVDDNHCNDLAIGAAVSGTAYVYRCVPTITVHASIKVPDAMNLPHNATGFTALFCVTAPARPQWSHVKAEFKTKIVVDPEENRATISEDSQDNISIAPGNTRCNEQTVDVKSTADLSKPISMKLFLEPIDVLKNNSTVFNHHSARLSEDSVLESSFLIQLLRDCGEDMICTPWLEMTLETFENPYTPGLSEKLGAKLTILNTEEPAYGARVNITLPLIPKRLPSPCTLEGLVMTCNVPAPLFRDENVSWDIELEYKESNETVLKIIAELDDPLYNRNISKESVVEVMMEIQPIAVFNVAGKPLPNETIPVTRDKLHESGDVLFMHYFEISNIGPSSWLNTEFTIILPITLNISSPNKGCKLDENELFNINRGSLILECAWTIPAKTSQSIVLPLRFDLAKYGDLLEQNTTLNITTKVVLTNTRDGNSTATVTTTLVLDPAPPLWPIILGVVSGLILLAAIVFLLYKMGFFSRQQREMLKDLKDGQTQPLTESNAGSSTGPPSLEPDDSTQELLFDSD